MKLRYLLVYLAVLISLVFYLQLPKQDQKAQAIFSPVAANPTNQIDISKLTLTDYNHIFEKHNVVFISRDNSQKQVYFDDKQLQSLDLSPSQKQAAFYYDPNETNELKEHKLSFIILDLEGKNTKEIFHTSNPNWDVRSDLHWLGNNHVIFLRHCGTSCQGLTLLNIQTGEIKNATLSYMLSSGRPAYTHFEDWFGNNHEVNNFVEKVYTETVEGKYYLLFNMNTETGEKSGQEKFLFTESNLTLES